MSMLQPAKIVGMVTLVECLKLVQIPVKAKNLINATYELYDESNKNFKRGY